MRIDEIPADHWSKRMTGRKGSTGHNWTATHNLETDIGRWYQSWMGGAVLPRTPFHEKHGRLPKPGRTP